jgi:hypothetical protein
MITNFEAITSPLTEDELKLIPYLVDGLKKRDKSNAIKGEEICSRLQDFKKNIGISEKPKLTDSRLRKMVNYIRVNGLLPVGATSNGYFCITDRLEIERQVKSLKQRAEAINAAAEALNKFMI